MNFEELYKKIRAIEENTEVAPVHTDGPTEGEGIKIIGGPMPGMPGMPGIMGHNEPPKQQDSVSMSVNMNGNGAGGIRDLMSVLKNIEQGDFAPDHDEPSDEPQHDAPGHEEPIMGDIVKSMAAHAEEENQMMPQPEMDEEMGDDGETWANSAHGDAGAHVHGVDAVTGSGDDMNSKGKLSPLARAPGSNSLIRHHVHVNEELVDKLTSMYEAIKGEPIAEAYNPNNVNAQHEREMKASHKAELKKKADAGDESAKKRLQAIHDKEEARRDEFNARMERESVELSESTDILKLAKMLRG